MSTDNLDLLFEVAPPEALPGPPKSWVCVKTPRVAGKDSLPVLTPECMSAAEINLGIDSLIEELETIRKEAHRRYAAYYREQ